MQYIFISSINTSYLIHKYTKHFIFHLITSSQIHSFVHIFKLQVFPAIVTYILSRKIYITCLWLSIFLSEVHLTKFFTYQENRCTATKYNIKWNFCTRCFMSDSILRSSVISLSLFSFLIKIRRLLLLVHFPHSTIP